MVMKRALRPREPKPPVQDISRAEKKERSSFPRHKRPIGKRWRLVLWWAGLSALTICVLAYVTFALTLRTDPGVMSPDGNVTGLTSVLSRSTPEDMTGLAFQEVSGASGINFQHFPGTRQSLLPEDMGSGLAWGDYDGDGDPDLFVVNFQGNIQPVAGRQDLPGRHALYRNDGSGNFVNVAATAGLDDPSFGLGAAWADYDNDHDLDLYITNYGANRLYRNNGDGTFDDVTEQADVGDTGFGTGCAWGDFDNDGNVDLYVSNYVQFAVESSDNKTLNRHYDSEIPFTINPSSYSPQQNRLYRNNGDGTFAEIAEPAGVADPSGRSMGASWVDFDNDGLVDLYVANDVSSNGVFHNLGNGRFADIGAESLAADYRGAMGIAVGDIEADGDLDLFITHWIAQENALFENLLSEDIRDSDDKRRLFFMDIAEINGLGQVSLRKVGWATGLADFDNDGFLDLWVANGHTLENSEDPTQLEPQRMQIFRHQPGAGFYDMSERAGLAMAESFVGRGGAHADYDGDGRVDIAVIAHGGKLRLLRNTTVNNNHWLKLRLRQRGGNTFALGARVKLRTGERTQYAQVGTEGSYLSQHDSDLHFGLGTSDVVDEIQIYWPDGSTTIETHIGADRVVEITHIVEQP